MFPEIMGHLHNCLEMRRNSLDASVKLENFGLFKNAERFDFFSPNLETKTLALL